ncbi:MAG: Uma2 family endonuclease [Nostoc sp. ChiQUE02]|uniref:Uma2 family endonuclease n=1 Tax=Nostoc sp. ChiQUE02 TaxID=3075377 RepID=UPI002AD4804C|nr:Uma2 family endonuclease [Nostoc sp. ChiQUE02]MDZ8233622.1 Uma2 family endonuclease [Nostoc sp. ChiQUE02]
MSDLQTQLPTDTWIYTSWEEYEHEELGIAEYWVVDVQNAQIIAYAIADQGSKCIQESQVLPGLAIAILEEALRRSREINLKWELGY